MEPLPTSSMTSGSKYPRRHQRAFELFRIWASHYKTTWNETVSELSFCFLSTVTGRSAHCSFFPQVSSILCLWLPRSRIFRAHLLLAHFLFWQLLEPVVLLPHLRGSSLTQFRSSVTHSRHGPTIHTTGSRHGHPTEVAGKPTIAHLAH